MRSNPHFTRLQALIRALSPPEIKIARIMLGAFHTNSTANDQMSIKLLNLLYSRPAISFEQAWQQACPGTQLRTFEKRIQRMESRINESICLDINLPRVAAFSVQLRAKITARNLLTRAELLHGKGLANSGERLFDKAIRIGQEFELFDQLEEALNAKCQLLATRLELEGWTDCLERRHATSEARLALANAQDWYYRHFTNLETNSTRKARLDLLVEALGAIRNHAGYTGSSRARYFCAILQIEYYLAADNLMACCTYALQVEALVRKQSRVFGRFELASIHSDLASYYLAAYNPVQARHFVEKALAVFPPGSHNHRKAHEWKLWADLYLGVGAASIQEVQNDAAHWPKESRARLMYLRSYQHFLQGDFPKAFVYLQETQHLDADKPGWNLGIRFLTMMIHVEMDLDDAMESMLISTRQLLKKLEAEQPHQLRDRDRITFKVLRELHKHSFNYKLVAYNLKKDIDKLWSLAKPMRWEPCTHEVIPFHSWLEAKVRNEPYEIHIPANLLVWMEDQQSAQSQDNTALAQA